MYKYKTIFVPRQKAAARGVFIIFFAFTGFITSYSQWVPLNSGTSNILTCVSFTDVNTGTVGGLTGLILKTTNGGTNWVVQPTGTTFNFWALQFINSNTGLIAGEGGKVYKTTNGGVNWTFTSPQVENFWGCNLLSANIAYVCGSTGLLIKTTDGCATWVTLNTSITSQLSSVNFSDFNTGYCAGSAGKILKTTDGGASFQQQTTGTTEHLFYIKPLNGDTVYACGENGILLKTINGGNSWSILTSGTGQRLISISFPAFSSGSMCGLNNTIIRTTNYGATWNAQNGISGQDFFGITFVNTLTGYCVGSNGNILKTITGGFLVPPTPNLLLPANGANGVSLTALLSWDSSTASKTYSVQLAGDSSFTSNIIDTANLVFSFMNIPAGTLSNNTQYFWHTRGTNGGGNGNWSNAFRFTTIVALPTAPGLLLPVNGASNVSITPSFDWDSTSPALFYRLQVSSDSSFISTSEVDVTGITVSNFNLVSPPLSHNARYYWRVQSTNAAGSGPWSNRFSFTTSLAIPSPPTLVSPPDNAQNVSLTPTLDWRDDISVITYQAQLSTDSTFTTSLVDTTSFSVSQVTIRSGILTPVQRYYWRVRTTNILGTGPWSVIWDFRTLLTAPVAPVLNAPPNGATDISTIVTVDWNDVPFADNYRIQVSPDSTFQSSNLLVNLSVTASQYTIQGGTLQNNTVYYWRVNATNSVGTGPYSTVWHFRTVISAPLAAPSLISPPNGVTLSNTTPTLDWNDVFGTTGYKINIAADSLFISPIDTNVVNSIMTVPAGRLSGGTRYYWRVRGFNVGGFGPWSTFWSFTTGIVGINIISTEIPKSYKLYNNYPNPFNPSTKIRFDIPLSSHVTLKVYDILGRQVSQIFDLELKPGTYEAIWNADNIASGIYFYRLETEQFTAVKKMLYVK